MLKSESATACAVSATAACWHARARATGTLRSPPKVSPSSVQAGALRRRRPQGRIDISMMGVRDAMHRYARRDGVKYAKYAVCSRAPTLATSHVSCLGPCPCPKPHVVQSGDSGKAAKPQVVSLSAVRSGPPSASDVLVFLFIGVTTVEPCLHIHEARSSKAVRHSAQTSHSTVTSRARPERGQSATRPTVQPGRSTISMNTKSIMSILSPRQLPIEYSTHPEF